MKQIACGPVCGFMVQGHSLFFSKLLVLKEMMEYGRALVVSKCHFETLVLTPIFFPGA